MSDNATDVPILQLVRLRARGSGREEGTGCPCRPAAAPGVRWLGLHGLDGAFGMCRGVAEPQSGPMSMSWPEATRRPAKSRPSRAWELAPIPALVSSPHQPPHSHAGLQGESRAQRPGPSAWAAPMGWEALDPGMSGGCRALGWPVAAPRGPCRRRRRPAAACHPAMHAPSTLIQLHICGPAPPPANCAAPCTLRLHVCSPCPPPMPPLAHCGTAACPPPAGRQRGHPRLPAAPPGAARRRGAAAALGRPHRRRGGAAPAGRGRPGGGRGAPGCGARGGHRQRPRHQEGLLRHRDRGPARGWVGGWVGGSVLLLCGAGAGGQAGVSLAHAAALHTLPPHDATGLTAPTLADCPQAAW